ncbi:hypothetical protein ACFE04_025185 [Oxalis oulophora]
MTTLYMPLFRSCTNLRTLTQLHTHLLITGVINKDPLASTKLIESYAQMGTLQSSTLVFQTFQNQPDSFMWGMLLKCYVWNHSYQQALSFYHTMIHHQLQTTSYIFPSVLRASSASRNLPIGREVHGRIIKQGFGTDSVIQTSLLNMYGEIGSLSDATKIFDEMSIRDVVSWSSMISSCVDDDEVSEALEIFRSMISELVEPDSVTMLSVAEASGELGSLRLARSVHGYILRRNILSYGSLDNALIVMYSKCSDLHSAETIFINISNPSTTSWTSMLSSYNRSGLFLEALRVFSEMLKSDEYFNSVTMMGVIGSCTGLGLLREGKSAHCFVIKRDVELEYDFLATTLIKLYAECGKLGYCKKIMHTIGQQNIVLTNMLISIYVQKGLFDEALIFFTNMHSLGLVPDSYTLASSLSACGDAALLQLGDSIHGFVIKRNLSWDEFVQNSLIDMYAKNGLLDSASTIFNKIQQKSVVTWNSMISGFSQTGNSLSAIRLFDKMYLNCLEMNKVTFISVIQACANWGYLEKGKWIHHKLIMNGIEKNLFIDTALIDMYSKCGDLTTAQRTFKRMPEKNVVSWSTMIAGFGIHGQVEPAISLFNHMVNSGIRPNEITFMNILSACSHAGSVEKGKFYFHSMIDFEIKPNAEHYACMVDLLSRAGDLDEAYRLIKSMQYPADASIWGALLNGCSIHQRSGMIKFIEKDLVEVRTDDTGYYTLLSNIHAGGGNWNKAKKVRSLMKGEGLKKIPGYSTIELDQRVYQFVAGEKSTSLPQEMSSFLQNFQILASYDVGGSNFVANNSDFFCMN